MENVLSVRGLCKSYGGFALKDVSFDVRRGEIMGFIGRNGAGKTTTLRSLMDMVHPDAGEACFFGEPLQGHEREVKQRVGFVSGGVDYYMRRRLGAITEVTRRFYPEWDAAAYARYMRMFALDERKTPAELSAGMRVKYNLALALSHRAELMILDEPTSGLDPVSRDELLDVLLALARGGVSILFSTHITSDLDKCADSITYIRSGRIAASCALEEFVNAYRALELSEEQLLSVPRELLIGLKPAKRGYTALVRAQDAAALPLECGRADLDTIIVHMEKEGEL